MEDGVRAGSDERSEGSAPEVSAMKDQVSNLPTMSQPNLI